MSMPEYYSETEATLRDALAPSFGAGQAIGRLLKAVAWGQRAAKELLALRERLVEEEGETPDHLAVNALDYRGIAELAEKPVLSDRDLEALGSLLENLSYLQAEAGLSWELDRIKTGESLFRLAAKLSKLSQKDLDPDKVKEILEALAKEMGELADLLSGTAPWLWDGVKRTKAWEARKRAEETLSEAEEDSPEERTEETGEEDIPSGGKQA